MCGRFSIVSSKGTIEERFDVILDDDDFKSVYNAAPTQKLPLITNVEPGKLNFYKWGLIPFWAKDQSLASKMINARADTILEKPAFKGLIKRRRCLVISDGFYEWKQLSGGKKQPYRITLKDNGLYAYAGLWDEWNDPAGSKINSFTIITTDPNELMKEIHNRMPVILKKENEKKWLSNHAETEELLFLLKEFPAELMKAYPVSMLVNSPLNNDEKVLLPL
jgi:putative SOS response-associated peptidase YedK